MLTFCLFLALQAPSQAATTADAQKIVLEKCVLCHRIDDKGNDFGPNLSDVGLRLTREQITESIVEPSKTIAKGFEFTELSLMDGNKPAGILAPESAGQYLLKQPGGIVHRYDKSTVRKATQVPVSGMMLFTDKLTEEQIKGITDFLLTLRTPVPKQEVREIEAPPRRETPTVILYAAAASAIVLGFIVLRGTKKSA